MTTDLASLFAPPPAAPDQAVTYRQGTVVTFNPATLGNTVNVGGTVLVDLPLLGVAEAASLSAGSVVGILAIGSATGTVTYAILGRLVTPGTPAAIDALSHLSESTKSASVVASETTSATTYVDLPTVGPVVTIRVPASGHVLVIFGAVMQAIQQMCKMSFALTGANTVSADTIEGDFGGVALLAEEQPAIANTASIIQVASLTGLTPGATTFTAKYTQSGGTDAGFYSRNLTVIAL